ncbi:hypothetical protein FHW69_001014 [Luteibacter sp. Sphag1AF]|uniref:hypothetical protein n=1 Tax=Luteibacter sp. Sphag1AF TaxID=2587031 RepID=UPI0016135E26|nr:hypothetical protein [Luteibacter sp. Sphag1AF]MBB3226424.1 hypothetical protein [Luteibacter sp. Sphag1AF]
MSRGLKGACLGATAHWLMDLMCGKTDTFELVTALRAIHYQAYYENIAPPSKGIRSVYRAVQHFLMPYGCTTTFETAVPAMDAALYMPGNTGALLGFANSKSSHSVALMRTSSGRRFLYCINVGVHEWVCSPANSVRDLMREYNELSRQEFRTVTEGIICTTRNTLPINGIA